MAEYLWPLLSTAVSSHSFPSVSHTAAAYRVSGEIAGAEQHNKSYNVKKPF